jgi:hypothetical protein
VPRFKTNAPTPDSWLKPVSGETLAFRTAGQESDLTFVPLYQVREGRYSIYWAVA